MNEIKSINNINHRLNYIDLFAGAGGLSEGFIRNGFNAIAHIEMNKDAVNTLKTRLGYYYLKKNNKINIYYEYLKKSLTREQFYSFLPEDLLNSVILEKMSTDNIEGLFKKIDMRLNGESIDIIVGGPPCQAYSLVGRSKQKRIQKEQENGNVIDDDRKYLYKLYSLFIKYYKPKLFVFENVPGLLSLDKGKYWKDIKDVFKNVGYEIEYNLLNSKTFGVPQDRKRVILIGWLKGTNYKYPKFKTKKANCKLKDLLQDLPVIQAGEELNIYSNNEPHPYVKKHFRKKEDILTWHIARFQNERDREIYRIAIKEWTENNQRRRLRYSDLPERLITHKNKTDFGDRYKIVPPDMCYSHTVLAHIAKDGHYYIHYDIEQARSLSVREAARLQSFPDNYYFEGSRTAAFTQIGNAVPPMMAEAIAEALRQQLESKKEN